MINFIKKKITIGLFLLSMTNPIISQFKVDADRLILQIKDTSTTNDRRLILLDSLEQISEWTHSIFNLYFSHYNRGKIYYSNGRYKNAFEEFEEALKYAKELKDPLLKADAYHEKARTYNKLNLRNYAILEFKKAAEIYLFQSEIDKYGTELNNIGFMFWVGTQYDSAVAYFNRALEIREALGNKEQIATTLNNLGTIYYQWSLYDLALENYFKAKELQEENKNNRSLALVETNIGLVYMHTGYPEKALQKFKTALKYAKKSKNKQAISYAYNSIGRMYIESDKDSAIYFFNKSAELYNERDFVDGTRIALLGLGRTYLRYGEYDKAREYFNKLLDLAIQLSIDLRIAEVNYYLAKVDFKEKKFKSAVNRLSKSLKIAGNRNLRSIVRDDYKLLADLNRRTGNYQKAYEAFEKYDSVRSQIDNERKNKKIEELQQKFLFEKYQKEILQQKFKNRTQMIYVYVVTVFSLLVLIASFFIYFMYKKIKRKNDELEVKNELIEKQSLLLSDKNKRLREIDEARDKLFSIIAHDLRSPFFGLINYSDILIDDFSELSEEERMLYINNINQILKSTYELLENLLHLSAAQMGRLEINPENLNVSSIIKGIISLFSLQIEQKELEIENDIPSDLSVYADENTTEVVIRNLINNAIKYSNKGGNIIFSAEEEEDAVRIVVEDTGVGMTEETVENLFRIGATKSEKGTAGEKGTGLGLSLCRDFTELNNGSIIVKSVVNKGTRIELRLPKKNEG